MDVQERLNLTKEYVANSLSLLSIKSKRSAKYKKLVLDTHRLGMLLGIEAKWRSEMNAEEKKEDYKAIIIDPGSWKYGFSVDTNLPTGINKIACEYTDYKEKTSCEIRFYTVEGTYCLHDVELTKDLAYTEKEKIIRDYVKQFYSRQLAIKEAVKKEVEQAGYEFIDFTAYLKKAGIAGIRWSMWNKPNFYVLLIKQLLNSREVLYSFPEETLKKMKEFVKTAEIPLIEKAHNDKIIEDDKKTKKFEDYEVTYRDTPLGNKVKEARSKLKGLPSKDSMIAIGEVVLEELEKRVTENKDKKIPNLMADFLNDIRPCRGLTEEELSKAVVGNKRLTYICKNCLMHLPDALVRSCFNNSSTPLKMIDKKNARPNYNQDTDSITIDNKSFSSMFDYVYLHEFGHRLESKVPGIYRVLKEFYEYRTQGETIQQLPGYDSNEVHKPDKFVNPYCGKYYPVAATEILSMGIQQMFSKPQVFFQDKEYAKFILGILCTMQ